MYPCHKSKIKNYIMQHVIIQNDLKLFHYKCSNQLILFLPKPYKLHISQFCPISLKT